MNRNLTEKFGTVGAVIAAAACPICFPKIALVGAAVGLGAFAAYESYVAIVVQALFVVAFAGQVLTFPRHRNVWLLALSGATTALIFVAYYVLGSSVALQIALGGLVIASVWQMVELKRCAKCEVPDPASRSMVLQSMLTCPKCGHVKSETMPVDSCQFFYECSGCGVVLRPKDGDCCVFCSFGTVKCPPKQASCC